MFFAKRNPFCDWWFFGEEICEVWFVGQKEVKRYETKVWEERLNYIFVEIKENNKNNNTRLVNRFTLSIIDLDLSYQDLSYHKEFIFFIDSCRLDQK